MFAVFMRKIRESIRAVINSAGYDIIYYKQHDDEIFSFYESHVFPELKHSNLTLFDIGANKGEFSRDFLARFPNSSCFLFEPIPSMGEAISNNLLGMDFTFIPAAVSNNSQTKKFQVYNNHDVSSFLKIDPDHSHAKSNYILQKSELEVPCVTLDAFVDENQIEFIDLLKVDTQGGELDVLKGAAQTIKSKVNFIQLEISFNGFYVTENYFGEIMKILENNNFNLIKVTDASHFADGKIMQIECIFEKK